MPATKAPRERDIEARLCERVKANGGIAYKFTSPNRRNVPDRLVILPGVPPFFVECKAPGVLPTAAQCREHKRLLDLGVEVYLVDTYEKAEGVAEATALREAR